MSDRTTAADQGIPAQNDDPEKPTGSATTASLRRIPASALRNLGLVIALVLLWLVGAVTSGESFASMDNTLTILRLGSALGVIAIGMTFVITGGGIDLSVGAVAALASVWASTSGTLAMAEDMHWIVIVTTAMLVGTAAGVVNGVLIAYGGVVPFIATLAMLASARGLAELMSDQKTQIVTNSGFLDFFRADPLGISVLIIIFAVVAVIGWIVLNRTTFGRRTFAVGGNPEAARLAGIKVQRHTLYLYAVAGLCAGIAAVMLMARTTTGTSTHGQLYELDAIAAVVIGGTLLSGGRGSIIGTVLGVLILNTLINVFTQNNMSISAQSTAKGVIIVVAVLLQQWLAKRNKST